jgi:hypothetical protein
VILISTANERQVRTSKAELICDLLVDPKPKLLLTSMGKHLVSNQIQQLQGLIWQLRARLRFAKTEA